MYACLLSEAHGRAARDGHSSLVSGRRLQDMSQYSSKMEERLGSFEVCVLVCIHAWFLCVCVMEQLRNILRVCVVG